MSCWVVLRYVMCFHALLSYYNIRCSACRQSCAYRIQIKSKSIQLSNGPRCGKSETHSIGGFGKWLGLYWPGGHLLAIKPGMYYSFVVVLLPHLKLPSLFMLSALSLFTCLTVWEMGMDPKNRWFQISGRFRSNLEWPAMIAMWESWYVVMTHGSSGPCSESWGSAEGHSTADFGQSSGLNILPKEPKEQCRPWLFLAIHVL